MKNIPLTNLVEQAVLDQMQMKASFTALDISNTLKFERYPVQHREVAALVREIYESGAMAHYDYERETIPVVTENGTKQARAFLYHYEEIKPRTYQTRAQDALPAVAPSAARDLADCAPAGAASILPRPTRSASSQLPRSSPRCRTRRDGALAVPKQIVARLGWSDGTRLALRQDGGSVVVEAAVPSSAASSLTVWRGQRLRICRTKLKVGALSADTVVVEIAGDGLRVKRKC